MLAYSDWCLQNDGAIMPHSPQSARTERAMILNMKAIRNERGLTLEQLAELTGLSKGFLSQLETGSRQPSTESIGLLAAALRVEPTALIASGFAEPGPPASLARRVLENLDKPAEDPTHEFKIGTDGKRVQIIATVDREGLARLIKQLEAMMIFLDA